MIADQRVIENIQKLNNLGMSKKDIKDNLLKMGLNDSDCEELIKKALKDEDQNDNDKNIKIENEKPEKITEIKETPIKEEEKEELPKNLFSKNSDEEENKTNNNNNNNYSNKEIDLNLNKKPKTNDDEKIDISKGLDLSEFDKINIDDEKTNSENKNDEDIDSFKNDLEKAFNIEDEKENTNNTNFDFENNINIDNSTSTNQESGIWQSGLVTTINSKLNEIESKQKQIEQYLKSKIDSEVIRLKKVEEVSKQLLAEKINTNMQEESSKIEQIATRQLAQIKIEQAKLNKKVNEIESGKEQINALVKEIEEMKSGVTKENIKAQGELKKVAATTSVKLNAKMKQINEILTLQSRISQGLIKNTQEAINKEMDKLNLFKEGINSQINPHKLYDKLNEIEKFKEQLATRYENRFENVKNEFLKKAQNAFKDKIDEELKDIKKYRDEIANKTDPEIINKKIEELEIFEKHLLGNIDEKISQSLKIYESGVTQEFKNKIGKLDEYYTKVENLIARIEMTQDTIKEINNFKDQFIAIVDKNIEKMNSTIGLVDKKLKELSNVNNNNNILNNNNNTSILNNIKE